ncbi:esterase-like activity of phytase family protein [Paraburkholderia rhizosphaerae]|uniref:Phytase-like protein with esterase activity n=1 Tax=Paraburkholderia rhizosphaerae TaxID=480658 RepID=A0A4R8M1B7_9BURK|nr:esterase-like activity of phytase family protein [Paraburkholderia rhizosphaerae]TDY54920.1 phytase-like protein with esterase activity [Paraburkholderia rhizosphaerae]
MSKSRPFAFTLIASLFAASTAHAGVDLIAKGQISGLIGDLSSETAAPLENGAAGNLLGGIGSGMSYAGCNTFVAVPDRGPNAISYNAAIDDTASYINRFQTLRLQLAAAPANADLPFVLTPTLTDTTLLHTDDHLVYGSGAAENVPPGAPKLNRTHHTNYFTGRSDNFDPAHVSTFPLDARFDPESIRVANDGDSVFISDEYGPYIYRFDRRTGQRVDVIKVPSAFAVSTLSPVGSTEISQNMSGRVANKGMEGLAISPDGKTLFGAMQSPLLQDGGTNGGFTRILRIDLRTGKAQQFAYPLTNIGTAAKPNFPTISDVVAVNDHVLLMDERDGHGLGDGSAAAFKKVFRIDLDDAADVSNTSGNDNLKALALQKTLFLDVVTVLNQHGINANDIPAKLESLTFGPDITVKGVRKHTLLIANDNDFVGTVTDSLHPNGVANPNQFFVFAVDKSDLPDFVPQHFTGRDRFEDGNSQGHGKANSCSFVTGGDDDDDQDHGHHDHGHNGPHHSND